MWSVGASDVVSVWALQPNKQSGRGSSLWVCLLWSVGAFDVVDVWAWVIVGAAPCRCSLARRVSLRSECVCLMSEVGVAALCGCVSCCLWVPLMCSMCGGGLLWALQPLAGDYWPVSLTSKVGVAAFCGCVSCGLWVPLMWSVCGHVLLWALRPLVGVYWPGAVSYTHLTLPTIYSV